MNVIEAIKTRKSIRHFTDQKLTEEQIHTILEAGMSGPSAKNEKPFDFIVITDHDKMVQMADANGHPFADALQEAACAGLVCGNMSRLKHAHEGMWVLDASAAMQNMTLAAWELGIGSVWLGVYPIPERMAGQKALFELPEGIIPHSILALGTMVKYPSREKITWYEDRIHREQW